MYKPTLSTKINDRYRRILKGGNGGEAISPDLTAMSFDSQHLQNLTNVVGGAIFNVDGTKMYVTIDNGTTSGPYAAALDTAYTAQALDPSDWTGLGEFGAARTRDIQWGADGTSIICPMLGDDNMSRFDHTDTAYDMSTTINTTADSTSGSHPAGETNHRALAMSPDGTKGVYITNDTGRDLLYGTFSTPDDLSTWTRDGKFIPAFGDAFTCQFSPDGSKLYVLGVDGILYQYNLSTAYDVSTADTTADASLNTLADKHANTTLLSAFGFTPAGNLFVLGYHVSVPLNTYYQYYTYSG